MLEPSSIRCAYLLATLLAFCLPRYAIRAASPAGNSSIPLCAGLTIVTAVASQAGDYESIKTVAAIDDKGVHLKYSAEVPNADPLIGGPRLKKVSLVRTVLLPDLELATGYQQTFLENSADTIPETTAIGASTAVLRALKSTGATPFQISAAYTGVEVGADRSVEPNYYSYLQAMTLKRTVGAPAHMNVIVNDVPTQLSAITAHGEFGGSSSEFTFLDDDRNPITLAYRLGISEIKPLTVEQQSTCAKYQNMPQFAHFLGRCDLPNGGDRDTLRVIRISYRCAEPRPGSDGGTGPATAAVMLERELEQSGKADVYSIYFSFNSDSIREESNATLEDIAELLRRHAAWSLRLYGHTDGIGTETANLDLSKRRAAAVKAALVGRYGIAADRLSTDGFGKSQPKDTNETVEGRAHNRRVELVRS